MPKTRSQLHQLVGTFATEAKPFIEGLGEPHPFIARLLKTFDWSAKDFKDFVLSKHVQLENSVLALDKSPPAHGDSRIEKLTHKIWLTSGETPHLPPAEYVTAFLAMANGHPPDWTHFFWSNSSEVLRHVSELAIKSGAKINVLDTRSLPASSLNETLNRLILDRKFVLAADVMKFVILDRYGGIYSDLGIRFDNEMLEMAAAADFGFLLASNMFFQTSWISLAKGSLLSTVFLGILNNPEVLSIEYALDHSKTVSAGTEVHTFAGLGYTLCALLFMPSSAKVFAFPQSSIHLSWNSQQSWYGDVPKHGNVLINDSLPSIITEERYAKSALQSAQCIRAFNANGRLCEMARIVVRLLEYFQLNEPALSRLLTYNGSDKVGAWHNYGYLYTLLFEIFLDRGCALLEVGDSMSLWGGVQAASGIGGGSQRVWKEYWDAATVGLEIDRSKNESDISQLVLVNGIDKQSLEAAIASWRGDVVIDNGVHQFEATVALLEVAFPSLNPFGLYVIEAVPLSDIERWETYLNAATRTALLIFLPHASNRSDNCMIVLFNTDADSKGPSSHIFGFPTWAALQGSPQATRTMPSRALYGENLQKSRNLFRDAYGSLSHEEWKAIWLSTVRGTNMGGLEFPAIPDPELQLQIHGSSSWETSMTEAFDFYRFVKSQIDMKSKTAGRFLDYGCGWGRMMRPFMRDFDLNSMFGFEPNLQLATIARSLNPYICVLSGGYTPDGAIPKDWFDVIVGWSIFSHLSPPACQQWLEEISQVLKRGGSAIFTTWGLRFLRRLQTEEKQVKLGQDVHWYSRMCIETAGDLSERIAHFEQGEFVWFTNTDSQFYGEAFVSETALRRIINDKQMPLEIVGFDTSTLDQDVFIVRRV